MSAHAGTAHDYLRDGAAIYARSFAIIRAEADLARFRDAAERVVVRMIHACGMTDLPADVALSDDFAEVATRALQAGAPILCDTRMVADGVTRTRLPAGNAVLCTLGDPRVAGLADAQGTTRSAAALELWREHLAGAVVAVGNAPTALFRLLELLDAGAPRPAAVIGVPVGFVGAAESKAALAADGRVPHLVVHGRRGGSAMAAAAVNALASPPRMSAGTLYGVGVGPGDPELMTLRAVRVLERADRVVHFCKRGRRGHARTVADAVAPDPAREWALAYPVTTELPPDDPAYVAQLAAFYDDAAARLADALGAGRSVAVLAEGDPFFYGSFMHLWRRLAPRFPVEVVPGVTGMSGCWARAGVPITWGDDVLTVLPATLDGPELARRLAATDAAVVMKLGRHLPKVRAALAEAGCLERAIYVERGTMADEVILPLAEKRDDAAPYFAMVLVPGRGRRP